MMKGKKGIEITTGTLIIIILAVIALIAIALFFMGGFKQVADTIKNIFHISTAGVSRDLAIQNCQQYCERAQSLDSTQQKDSAFCKTSFNIDMDDSGEADYTGSGDNKIYKEFFCSKAQSPKVSGAATGTLSVACSGVTCQ